MRARAARRDEAEAETAAPRPPVPLAFALQRTVGNAALARTKKRTASQAGLKPRPRKLTKAEVEETFSDVTEPRGHTGAGAWPETQNEREPQSFAGRRDEQHLRHLSTQFFLAAKKELMDEQEVQSMLVGNRILVAANNDASLVRLQAVVRDSSLRTVLETVYKPRKKSVRPARVAQKLKDLFAGERNDDKAAGAAGIVKALALRPHEEIDDSLVGVGIADAAGCQAAVTGDKYKQKILFVTGAPKALQHAEQKLIWALWESGATSATIYGKRRPCAYCWATFAFAGQHLGLHISNNPNPGGVWKRASTGLHFIAKSWVERTNQQRSGDVRVWLTALAGEYAEKGSSVTRGPAGQEFDSESDSDVEE